MSSGFVLALSLLVLLTILGALAITALIEGRADASSRRPVYVINDACDHIVDNLDEQVLHRIGRSGIRRVIEWSTHYLQGLAVPARQRTGLRVIAGGDPGSIEYVRTQLARRGYDYSSSDIAAVLAGEADYLAGIGALGEQVKEGESV